jgi:hypothetical protein
MFLGHFAAAFASKKADPSVSLGSSILAAQWLDLIWPIFLLADMEHAEIAPEGAVVPITFTDYPISHSLAAVLSWAVLIGAIYYFFTRNKRGMVVMGLLVVSHWFLDLTVHEPDLPLFITSEKRFGLGLWHYKIMALIFEIGLYAGAVYLYFKSNRNLSRKKVIVTWSLIIFLFVIHVMNTFGPPPKEIKQIAVVGLSQWILVAWGYWADYKSPKS